MLLGLFVGSMLAFRPRYHLGFERHGGAAHAQRAAGHHGSWRCGLWHIVANTSGLLILGWLCMWPRIANFWQATSALCSAPAPGCSVLPTWCTSALAFIPLRRLSGRPRLLCAQHLIDTRGAVRCKQLRSKHALRLATALSWTVVAEPSRRCAGRYSGRARGNSEVVQPF